MDVWVGSVGYADVPAALGADDDDDDDDDEDSDRALVILGGGSEGAVAGGVPAPLGTVLMTSSSWVRACTYFSIASRSNGTDVVGSVAGGVTAG